MSQADQDLLASFGATRVEDIEVVPGYRTPPSGEYQVTCECELKVINKDPAFVLKMTLDTDDETGGTKRWLKGDQFSQMFKGQKGLEYGRDTIGGILQAFGATTMQEAVDAGTVTAMVTIKSKADKEDADVVYANVKKITLV